MSANQLQPSSGANNGSTIAPEDFDKLNDAAFQAANVPGTGAQQAFTLLDPWGNPYVYVEWASVPQNTKDAATQNITSNTGVTGGETHALRPHDPSKFDIYSFGPNGINEGGEGDDIASWTNTSKR